MKRFLTILLLLLAGAAVAGPAPAHAMEIEQGYAAPRCDSAARLAGVIETEAMSQPIEAQTAIAQIVAAEAASRGMTVCSLTEITWFVAVYRYARARPAGWQARAFAAPQPWALALADDVLAGRLPDATDGAHHFDGVAHADDLFVIGQTHFQP